MARRNPRRRSHNFFNTGGASFRRTAMLNMHNEKLFRWGLRAVFDKNKVDPKIADPLGGMIFAKGSRNSIEAAKDFVDDKVRDGILDDKTARSIYDLLDKYGTWR
jgi:hypothetical protein